MVLLLTRAFYLLTKNSTSNMQAKLGPNNLVGNN